MGLAERKAIAAAKDSDYKEFEEQVKSICGFEVKLTFDWAMVENHADCIWICASKRYNGYMFEPVTAALKNICGDDMGREAIKAGLKEINMIPATGDLEFSAGVLTVRNDLTGNGAYGAENIQEVLEKGL